jgi:hypothetical protein
MIPAVAQVRPRILMLLAGHVLPIAFLVTLSALVFYDRRIPFDPQSLHGKALEASVKGADEIRIQWRLYRNRFCPTTISREFVDSLGVVHRLETVNGPFSQTLGWDSWISHVKVPAMTAWGTMRFKTTVQFHCGWTHEWFPLSIKTPEVVFEVLPPN